MGSLSTNYSIFIAAFDKFKTREDKEFILVSNDTEKFGEKPLGSILVLTLAPFIMKLINSAFCSKWILPKEVWKFKESSFQYKYQKLEFPGDVKLQDE